MNEANEIVGLVHKLASVMHNTSDQVMSVYAAADGRNSVLVEFDFFKRSFDTADIKESADRTFPFELTIEIDDVRFHSYITTKELQEWKERGEKDDGCSN